MQIAVCDDEKEIRDLLAEKVRKTYSEADIVCFRSGEELFAADRPPDILFLDIQMPGRNGMDAAKEIRRRGYSTILIFVTAMEEYVFQAFDVGAFHYLVKPFDDGKFTSVLQNAVKQYNEKITGQPDGAGTDRCIIIKSGSQHINVQLDDIVYAEVFNRKVMIHTMREDIEYYGRLSELQKMAGEDFFRPHRAYLIHFKYVVKYTMSSITLENGTALMAKANYSEFIRKFLQYNKKRH